MRWMPVSLLLFLVSPLASASVEANFDCGRYEVSGRLHRGSDFQWLIQVRSKSSSPYEVLLLGGDLNQRAALADQQVRAIVYVPHPIRDNHRPFVFLESLAAGGVESPPWEPRKLSSEPCGDEKRFQVKVPPYPGKKKN